MKHNNKYTVLLQEKKFDELHSSTVFKHQHLELKLKLQLNKEHIDDHNQGVILSWVYLYKFNVSSNYFILAMTVAIESGIIFPDNHPSFQNHPVKRFFVLSLAVVIRITGNEAMNRDNGTNNLSCTYDSLLVSR